MNLCRFNDWWDTITRMARWIKPFFDGATNLTIDSLRLIDISVNNYRRIGAENRNYRSRVLCAPRKRLRRERRRIEYVRMIPELERVRAINRLYEGGSCRRIHTRESAVIRLSSFCYFDFTTSHSIIAGAWMGFSVLLSISIKWVFKSGKFAECVPR